MKKLTKYIIPGMMVLPMIIHWLLPSGIETKLYLPLFGNTFFAPDLLYFLYFIRYAVKRSNCRRYLSRSRRAVIVVLCISIIAYTALTGLAEWIPYLFTLLASNLSMVWFTLLFMLAPMTERQIQLTRPFMVVALVLLVLEVVIYSLGIMTYTTAANNTLGGQDYGGIMRISTTIGAATGTAVVISFLGAVCITIYPWKERTRLALILITTIGVFFTMSRGSSALWILFLSYLFYKEYFKAYSYRKRLKSLCGLSVIVIVFYAVGGFDPILNRFEHMNESEDVTAGRGSKFEKSMRMIEEKEPWGYGLGQVMPDKGVEAQFSPPHHFAPHNMYTLIAIELGWPGLLMFIMLILIILSGLDFKRSLSIYICLVFMVNANTESVLLDSEYSALILFAAMSVTKFKNNRYESYPVCYKA